MPDSRYIGRENYCNVCPTWGHHIERINKETEEIAAKYNYWSRQESCIIGCCVLLVNWEHDNAMHYGHHAECEKQRLRRGGPSHMSEATP